MNNYAAVGELIGGRYRVQKVLGRGGMGIVLQAEDERLQRVVALKVLWNDGSSKQAVARLAREARAMARLRSVHVARVIDFYAGELGPPFIVMERLEGEDLRSLLKRQGQLPLHLAARYIRQACLAIFEAHSIGILHRDVKPSNLFLAKVEDEEPIIKVVDFGIVKGVSGGLTGAGLTKGSVVLGTPKYVAPERIRREDDADRRSDIWSLGAVLYELLAGEVPFPAPNLAALIVKVVSAPAPDVRLKRSEVPEGLSQIVARCLAMKREQRFASAQELADALFPYCEPQLESLDTTELETAAIEVQAPSVDQDAVTCALSRKQTTPVLLPQRYRSSPPQGDRIAEYAATLPSLGARTPPALTSYNKPQNVMRRALDSLADYRPRGARLAASHASKSLHAAEPQNYPTLMSAAQAKASPLGVIGESKPLAFGAARVQPVQLRQATPSDDAPSSDVKPIERGSKNTRIREGLAAQVQNAPPNPPRRQQLKVAPSDEEKSRNPPPRRRRTQRPKRYLLTPPRLPSEEFTEHVQRDHNNCNAASSGRVGQVVASLRFNWGAWYRRLKSQPAEPLLASLAVVCGILLGWVATLAGDSLMAETQVRSPDGVQPVELPAEGSATRARASANLGHTPPKQKAAVEFNALPKATTDKSKPVHKEVRKTQPRTVSRGRLSQQAKLSAFRRGVSVPLGTSEIGSAAKRENSAAAPLVSSTAQVQPTPTQGMDLFDDIH